MNKILVIYIGVAGIRSEDIQDYCHKLASKIVPTTFEGEVIMLPIQSYDTRIECINPQYITETNLVNEHTELMKKLHEELRYQLIKLREQNDGDEPVEA